MPNLVIIINCLRNSPGFPWRHPDNHSHCLRQQKWAQQRMRQIIPSRIHHSPLDPKLQPCPVYPENGGLSRLGRMWPKVYRSHEDFSICSFSLDHNSSSCCICFGILDNGYNKPFSKQWAPQKFTKTKNEPIRGLIRPQVYSAWDILPPAKHSSNSY